MSLTARPDPREVIEGIRSTLVTYILPSLEGEAAEIARNRLQSAVALLAWLAAHWDGQAQALAQEVTALEAALAEGAAVLRDAGRPDEAERLKALAAAREPSLLLSDLRRRSDALQEGLLELAKLALVEEVAGLEPVRERVAEELTALVRRRLA
jgi:hypothetical protein